MASIWISSHFFILTVILTFFQLIPLGSSQGPEDVGEVIVIDLPGKGGGNGGGSGQVSQYCERDMFNPYYKACFFFCKAEKSCFHGTNGDNYCYCPYPGCKTDEMACYDPMIFTKMPRRNRRSCKRQCKSIGKIANICTYDLELQPFCVCFNEPLYTLYD